MTVRTRDKHPLSGKTVRVKDVPDLPKVVKVVDWYDRNKGRSWHTADNDPAALLYAQRVDRGMIPDDADAVLTLCRSDPYLFHHTELSRGEAQDGRRWRVVLKNTGLGRAEVHTADAGKGTDLPPDGQYWLTPAGKRQGSAS